MAKQFRNKDIAENFFTKSVTDLPDSLPNEFNSTGIFPDIMAPYVQEDPNKKVKLQRMNMGFFDDHLEYIRTMSRIKGQTMTQYINALIAADKIANSKIYQKAKDLSKEI